MRTMAERLGGEERHSICILVLVTSVALIALGAAPDAVKTAYATLLDGLTAWGASAPDDVRPVGGFITKWLGGAAVGAPFLTGYWLLYRLLGLLPGR